MRRLLSAATALVLAVALAAPAKTSHISRPGGIAHAEQTGDASTNAQRPDIAGHANRLRFEPNVGQLDERVSFVARSGNSSVFITPSAFVVSSVAPPARDKTADKVRQLAPRAAVDGCAVQFRLIGSNPDATVTGEDELPGRSSYFLGSDSTKWRTDIPTYGRVRVHDARQGTDIVYYDNGAGLEYDVLLAPGARPDDIAFAVEGADAVSIADNGDMVVSTSLGEMRQQRPVVYQERDGRRESVHSRFQLHDRTTVGIDVGAYDPLLPLVIDPSVGFVSVIGGSGPDGVTKIAMDGTGSIYIAGTTNLFDFPLTPGPFKPSAFYDITVSKLSPDGTILDYSAVIGGAGYEQLGGVAVDAIGNAYVAGLTGSTDFPVVGGLSNGGSTGSGQAFVLKLGPSGTSLVYSDAFGGSDDDGATALAIDGLGFAYVGGQTRSADFPATAGFDTTYNGEYDAFVAKISATGSSIVYATYVGGSDSEYVGALAVDASGAVVICGNTSSFRYPNKPNVAFPTTSSFQPALQGRTDAFVTKLNPSGTSLVFSTMLGGHFDEYPYDVAFDNAGNVCLCGVTSSPDFPAVNAVQAQYAGGTYDGFITRLSSNGASLLSSTFYGGSGDDRLFGILVDSQNRITAVGSTQSAGLPAVNAYQPAFGGMDDGIVARLSPNGAALESATYFGGAGQEGFVSGASDGTGGFAMLGYTYDPAFLGAGADFGSLGSSDGFVLKLFLGASGPAPSSPATCAATPVDATHVSVSWSDTSGDETAFKLERRLDPAGSWAQIAVVGPNSQAYLDPSVSAGTGYAYRVRSTNGPADSGWSNEAVTATPALGGAPSAPSHLYAAAAGGPSVGLGWIDQSANETGFEIERATSPSGPWSPAGTAVAQLTNFVDTGMTPPVTLSYRVRAVNAAGQSAWSNVATVSVPGVPSGVVTLASADNYYLYWGYSSADATDFVIERRDIAASTWTAVASIPADVTQREDYSATYGAAYVYRVRATNAAGMSAPSNEVASTFDAIAVPGGLTPVEILSGLVSMQWSVTFGVRSGYVIERRTGLVGPFAEVGRVTSGNLMSYVDTTVAAGTQYTYRVKTYVNRGLAGLGYSDPSEDLVVTSLGNPPPGAMITVSTAADGNIRDTALTLREALLVASGALAAGALTAQERALVSGTPAVPGFDVIHFAIGGTGVRTITLASALPDITDAVRIDATSQAGYSGTPLIELSGASAGSGGVDGIRFGAFGCSVAGMCINRFSGDGVEANGAGAALVEACVIGTDPSATIARQNSGDGVRIVDSREAFVHDSLLSGNGAAGVEITGSQAAYCIISRCRIGTNSTGTASLPNAVGVVISASAGNSTIGGATPADGNLISGNAGDGVHSLAGTGRVTIGGNLVGTDVTGTAALGNQGFGVSVSGGYCYVRYGNVISGNALGGIRATSGSSPYNYVQGNLIGTNSTLTAVLPNLGPGILLVDSIGAYIGGTTAELANVVAGNAGSGGIVIQGSSASNAVLGNFVGVTRAGLVLGQPGNGIRIEAGNQNNIGDGTPEGRNTIAGTAAAGVAVLGGIRNAIQWNVIRNTGGLPVDLGPTGPTANDPGDGDTGANDLTNAPVLTSAIQQNGHTMVTGKLSSLPSSYFELNYYVGTPSAPALVPTAAVTIATDAAGDASFSVDLVVGVPNSGRIWATATFLGQSANNIPGETSEFSNGAPISGVSQGADSPGVFQASSAAFFLRNTNDPGNADVLYTFGAGPSTYVPLTGDWNGDGVSTPGLYDPATGAFFLRNANSPGPADIVFTFGAGGSGRVPMVGDWNGDGIDTIGLYVAATGTFFLRNQNSGGVADLAFSFGAGGSGVVPLAGDWDADGIDTVGLYASATGAFFLKNANAGGAADTVFTFGAGGAGIRPLSGDWDGNGRDSIGLYVSASGTWFLRNSNSPGGADFAFSYGPAGAVPLVGDWNGQ